MIVCAECGKEMRCEKTGHRVAFQEGTHVYAGDRYTCVECCASVVVCNQTAYSADPPLTEEAVDVTFVRPS
jgi:hypothetical protein